MTDASIYPFRWTPAFGTRMRQLRRQLGDPPYETVEAAGGPTVLDQDFIEKGLSEDASPGTVTEDTIRQYAQAYTRLSAPRGSEARELCPGSAAKEWRSPEFRVDDEGFVMALGEAGAAVSDAEVLERRSREIDEAARRLTGDRFTLGSLASGELVSVGCLMRFWRGEASNNIAREEVKASGELFYQHVATVAGRHPTISVAAAYPWGDALARHWHSEDSVKRNVLGQLDPIDGIRSLSAARQRAIVLKADEDRLDAVAPMIVLINALTDQLNGQSDASESPLTALNTWRRFKENPDKWRQLLPSIPGETWGALPDIKIMVAATERVLRRWEYARQDAPYELTYELGSDKRIEWTAEGVASPPGLSREAGDLWLVGERGRSDTCSVGVALIRAIGEPALHFGEDDEALVTMDSSSRHFTVQWCPSGVLDNIALVRPAGPSSLRGWRAIQIY